MALTPGIRLGVYEISAPLGKGGMGAVFRARDTKLDHDVAIKVLPEAFAGRFVITSRSRTPRPSRSR